MGATDEGAGKRECRCPDPGPDTLGSGTVGIFVWFRDMGDDLTHWKGVGRIPQQGGLQADG